VQGEFDDDTRISIVEFIRSQPPIPVSAFLKSVPAVPIGGIARGDDAIVVGLRPREDMGHAVWLVRKDGRWIITRSRSFKPRPRDLSVRQETSAVSNLSCRYQARIADPLVQPFLLGSSRRAWLCRAVPMKASPAL
jgi:hypothetical protein